MFYGKGGESVLQGQRFDPMYSSDLLSDLPQSCIVGLHESSIQPQDLGERG